ncbi:Mu transposase C-terminal domain-containing protein [Brucella tritici]|uniref:Mu transposase C-terminal domain-containing protein n=1 Tax=Brucella tritici TaxID=94626 RepID=UPI003D6CE1F3
MITDNNVPPTKLRFGRYDRISIGGTAYRCLETNADGHRLRRVDGELEEAFRHQDMAALFERGKVEIAREYFSTEAARTRLRNGPQHLSDLSPDTAAQVLWKAQYCDRFLQLQNDKSIRVSRSDKSMHDAIAKIRSEMIEINVAHATPETPSRPTRAGQSEVSTAKPPSPRTLRKWLRAYETCGCDPLALCNLYKRSGNYNRRLDPKVIALMRRHAQKYVDERKMTKEDCYRKLEATISTRNQTHNEKLSVPSKKTFFAVINSIDKFEVEAGQNGLQAAKKKFFVSHGGLNTTRPFERVEMDEWSVQLITLLADHEILEHLDDEARSKIERIRIHICVAIDCATRCILGISMAYSASSQNAVTALRMICTDKSSLVEAIGARCAWPYHGRPDLVATDNGASFIAMIFRKCVTDLKATHDLARAGWPQFRSLIERIFSTINMQFLSAFTGRTFSNVVARGDYPAEARATITVDELCDALIAYIVGQYHHQKHSGLGGETPANAWKRLTDLFGCPPPPGPEEMRAVFGVELERTIGSNGVCVLGLWYRSDGIQIYRRQHGNGVKVPVRIDPLNLGTISVFYDDAWHSVRCSMKTMEGVSIEAWKQVNADLRARFKAEAKIAEHIVHQTILDRQELSRRVIKRANISPITLTSEEIEQAERVAHGAKFEWILEQDEADADFISRDLLLDGSVEVPGPITVSESEAAPSTPIRRRTTTFRIEK